MSSVSKRNKTPFKLLIAIVWSAPVALFAGCDVVFATNREIGWEPRHWGFWAGLAAFGLSWVAISAFATRARSPALATARAFRVLAALAFVTPLIGFAHWAYTPFSEEYKSFDVVIFPAWALFFLSLVIALPLGFAALCVYRDLERQEGRSNSEEPST